MKARILNPHANPLRFAEKKGNPIIRDRGICDPHIHVFDGRAWLYSGKDRDWHENWWVMDEWQIWSSSDLVDWNYENSIKPENSYTGRNNHCWAGDCAYRNGHYYWYFSNHYTDTGVMLADSPAGDFEDALGRPLLPHDITPEGVHPYDPDIFMEDDGSFYIIFGTNTYYIARLNADMISLAEEPRPIEIDNPLGVADKPGLFKREDRYYLQWGGHYAMSSSLYGPYEYKGVFSDGHAKPFVFNGRWYVGYVQRDALFYRSTYISRLKFRDDGTVIPHGPDPYGIGRYDASRPCLDAEDYFTGEGIGTVDGRDGRDREVILRDGKGRIVFPRVYGIGKRNKMYLRYSCQGAPAELTVRDLRGGSKSTIALPATGGRYESADLDIDPVLDETDFEFDLRKDPSGELRLNWFSFDPETEEPVVPERQWDFLSSAEGWTTAPGPGPVGHRAAAIFGSATGFCVVQPPNFSVTKLVGTQNMMLRMRHRGNAVSAKFAFCIIDEQDIFNPENLWEEKNSGGFELVSDGAFHDYILDTGGFENWRGRLKQMRLEFIAASPKDDFEWEIAYIAIW